jgi:hypothetical protein
MNTPRHILYAILPLSLLAAPALAATIHFSGPLGLVEYDNGGVFSGTPLGTTFTGFVNVDTAVARISNGTITQNIGCCIAASGLDITNDEIITAYEAQAINDLLGTSRFSSGDAVDIVDIEGDNFTAGGGRIEVGLSYLLEPTAFDDDAQDNFPFDPADLIGGIFFIYEEDAAGADLYSGFGQITAVPLPAAAWLFGGALVGLAGLSRKRSRSSAG